MSDLFIITGTPASGKSTLLSTLAGLGFPVISADEIVADLYRNDVGLINTLQNHFGSSILKTTGEIDKKSLREIVFASKMEQDWLEKQVHPLVRSRFNEWLARQEEGSPCFYEVPLFFEINFTHPDIRGVIVCYASRETSIQRLILRGLSQKDAERLVEMQISAEQKKQMGDFIFASDNRTADEVENLLDWVKHAQTPS